jgi:hypothetical protein
MIATSRPPRTPTTNAVSRNPVVAAGEMMTYGDDQGKKLASTGP